MRRGATNREFESHPFRLRPPKPWLRRASSVWLMHSYKGIVQKGTQRAASLGFPTINIQLEDASILGIYAARVKVGREEYKAAAFADQKRKVLEAYILDFLPRELYGEEVTIELHKKIRDTIEFESDEALRAAIVDDVKKTRSFFYA